MKKLKIFISSVQSEFAEERKALLDYLQSDPLMSQFFDAFLFENEPATDKRPEQAYLDKASKCDVYVGLLGCRYGSENRQGLSPTEREFNRATKARAHRLIFVKTATPESRHPKAQKLIDKVQADLIRKRFRTPTELVNSLYAALVEYLSKKHIIQQGPFDAAVCPKATLGKLDNHKIKKFIRKAQAARDFPLSDKIKPQDLLHHLSLSSNGHIKNAAILLFAKEPQRFFISSEVKCAHFHSTYVAKPIPSHQIYTGTVFEMADQAIDFVLSKINFSVGTRAHSVQAPVRYEIPKEVVTEAIVNAIAHRDYTSKASVQVMLFSDRLEVHNPGRLPSELTIEQLRTAHKSLPPNRLLAKPLYLAKYIEQMGTGTLDMLRRCEKAGLPEPKFAIDGGFVVTIWRPSQKSWLESKGQVLGSNEPESRLESSLKRPESNAKGSILEVKRLESRLESTQKRLESNAKGSILGGKEPESEPESSPREPESNAKGSILEVKRLESRLESTQKRLESRLESTQKRLESNAKGSILEVKRLESGLESGLESRPDSMSAKVLELLVDEPISRADIAKGLGHKRVSGRLNKVIRQLLDQGLIELTIPNKPNSRLQKYRLTDAGQQMVKNKGGRI